MPNCLFNILITAPQRQTVEGLDFEFGEFRQTWYGIIRNAPGVIAMAATKEALFENLKKSAHYVANYKTENQLTPFGRPVKSNQDTASTPFSTPETGPLPAPELVEGQGRAGRVKKLQFKFDSPLIAQAFASSLSCGENEIVKAVGSKVIVYSQSPGKNQNHASHES